MNHPQTPRKHAWRAHIILELGAGCGLSETMRRTGISKPTVLALVGPLPRRGRRRPSARRHPSARQGAGGRGQGEGPDRACDVATAAACQPLDAAGPGGEDGDGVFHRAQHPAQARTGAAQGQGVQGVPGCGVRGDDPRRCRPLRQPARPRRHPLGRRKRPRSRRFRVHRSPCRWRRAIRDPQPRLQAQRHHLPDGDSRCRHRQGGRPDDVTAPLRRVHRLPRPRRKKASSPTPRCMSFSTMSPPTNRPRSTNGRSIIPTGASTSPQPRRPIKF